MKSIFFALFLSAGVLTSAPLRAQAPPAAAAGAPAVAGKTIDGKSFALSSLKGKVVLVMFWSTGCAVCRDKMGELRQNYEGWNGKPFEMVLVSTDRKLQDVQDYEKIISSTVALKQRFVQLWAGDPAYKDSFGPQAQLPATFLIDKSGKVVQRYLGRIPAEAWDTIADLL